MTIRHQDRRIVHEVHESKDVSNYVEEAEVETTAGTRTLLGWRHEAKYPGLPASVIGINIRQVQVGDGP